MKLNANTTLAELAKHSDAIKKKAHEQAKTYHKDLARVNSYGDYIEFHADGFTYYYYTRCGHGCCSNERNDIYWSFEDFDFTAED